MRMTNHDHFGFFLRLAIVLAFAGALLAQSAPDKILVVNGKTIASAIRQIDGHSYIDIETLAQVTNGSVTIEPNRIVLTIPTPNPGADAAAAGANAAAVSAAAAQFALAQQAFSRGFATAAISDLAEMREWRGAVGAMVTYGMAVSDAWARNYQERVQEGLAQAAVAATTDADHDALGLLQNESAQLATWANGIIAARQELNGSATVDPNALQNDRVLARIQSCSQFLNSMLVSGAFADDASCH